MGELGRHGRQLGPEKTRRRIVDDVLDVDATGPDYPVDLGGQDEVAEDGPRLEAEAPLANLLGYCDWAQTLTGGNTDVSMWLSRYLPIDDDGPYAA